MHQGIIFDLDGTLVDSLADLAGSVNRILGQEGFPRHPEEDFRLMVGNGMRVLVSRVLPEGKRDEDTITRLRGEIEAEYESHCLEFTRPYPGILELIEALKARSCRCAVLSNKPNGFTKRIIEALFPSGSFDIVQ
ncbi:MAG: HAD hydrolase-like protein, partial [Spirochaetota bacterium]